MTTTTTYKTRFHRDGTITVWNVYSQQWQRTSNPSDRVLAAIPAKDRERAIRHCGLSAC